MSKYASKVVEQAKKWLGKKESDGSFKEIIDIYNSHKPLARGYKVKYTDEWCSTFVSAVAIKLGYTDIIPTECGCEKHTQLFKNIGAWVENENRTPNAGDIIFYDWKDNGVGDNKGSADHVGIVEKVVGSKITVIEGNYNSKVARRTLSVNGKYIRGYGVPKYDKEPTKSKINVTYQTYDNQLKKYWSEITNYNNVNSNGYAGCMGHSIGGIRAKASKGTITIQSHIKGGNWLSPITKWDNTSKGYSGIYGKDIDMVMIKSSVGTARYRVHTKNGKWLGWITKYNINDSVNGMAGIYGKSIDAIQIEII